MSLFLLFALAAAPLSAQKPAKLRASQIAQLTQDGDRLADQGDYLAALGKYTEAYMGVVSKIRGQQFSSPVVPNMLNREQLGIEMQRVMKEEYTADELLIMDSGYKAFGLVPRGLDSEKLITDLLTEEVAGFYDPDTKRMVLIVVKGPANDPGWFGRLLGARPTFDKDEQKTTLAHELTHALQDQLYDLNAMEKGIEHDDDMLLAFSALVEGDATLLMFVESGGEDISEMNPDAIRATFSMMSWMMPLAGGEAYRKAPPIFRDSLIFPYLQGMIFTLTVAGESGWPGVHQAYRNPPLSTEQILHPEKYNDPSSIDRPQRVTIPDLSTAVGAEWKHLGGNCLGELQTSIMLKRVRGGKSASRGWDGDSYELFRNQAGELALVSVSIWDSDDDANEFAKAFQAYRDLATIEAGVFPSDSVRTVETKGDQVWIVEGFETTTSKKVIKQLPNSKFEEKHFPK